SMLADTIMLQFGIDLGGTTTDIIVLNESGESLLRHRSATPSQSYGAIVANTTALVHNAASELNTNDFTLGIGIPGAVSPATGLIKNANTTCLIGRDLQGDLQQALSRRSEERRVGKECGSRRKRDN